MRKKRIVNNELIGYISSATLFETAIVFLITSTIRTRRSEIRGRARMLGYLSEPRIIISDFPFPSNFRRSSRLTCRYAKLMTDRPGR